MINIKEQYEYLFRKYGESVFRVIYFYCKNISDSEDVLQNTFLKLYISDVEFESEKHVKNWIYKIAINEAINVSKSKWRKFQSLEDNYAREYQSEPELYECIMKLSKKYRIVIILYYYEGYGIKEIAELLNRKESTVQTQIHRTRKKLKNFMEE